MFMQDATRFVADPALPLAAPIRTGLLASTLVETETGWRPAGSLRRGDLVHTFDGGLRPVVTLDRNWLDAGASLIRLPGGVLGNAADQLLMPGQHLLIDTWEEAALPDTLIALIPAEAIAGLGGAVKFPLLRQAEVVIPIFQDDEVIYANGGLLMHCPGVAAGPLGRAETEYFHRLDLAQARALMHGRLAPQPEPKAATKARAPGWRRFWQAN